MDAAVVNEEVMEIFEDLMIPEEQCLFPQTYPLKYDLSPFISAFFAVKVFLFDNVLIGYFILLTIYVTEYVDNDYINVDKVYQCR